MGENNIINFEEAKRLAREKETQLGRKQHLFSVNFFKLSKTDQFSYEVNKHKPKEVTDDFARDCICQVLEDILVYNNDPELVQEIIEGVIDRVFAEFENNADEMSEDDSDEYIDMLWDNTVADGLEDDEDD